MKTAEDAKDADIHVIADRLHSAAIHLLRTLRREDDALGISPSRLSALSVVVFAGPVAAREVYRLDVASGALSQLTFGGNNAAASYSPDGQYIVFNSLRNNNQADLYIMRADGHSTRQLTTNPEPDWQPRWGP